MRSGEKRKTKQNSYFFYFLTTKETSVKQRSVTVLNTCHGAGAAMSPTGATVLGDVLVAGSTDVVDAVDISPIPGFWQIRNA